MTLLHTRFDDEWPFWRYTFDSLGELRPVVVTESPTPHSTFLKEWSREVRRIHGIAMTELSVADLYIIENARSSKNLEVFLWPIDDVQNGELQTVHWAFLLRVVDR